VSLGQEKDGVNHVRESEEPVIDFIKNDSDKKVRRRQIKSNKRGIPFARTTARTTHVKLARDVSFGRRNTALVLYQEICV